jgi:hypothetical protein
MYTLTQKEYSNLKRRLTIAKKRGPEAVVAECSHAFEIFNDKGWPDEWYSWEIAMNDARVSIRHRNWVPRSY